MSNVTTKRQVAPINKMAYAARRFAHGDFSVRVENEDRDDEIGELTTAFNEMAEAIEKSEELRREFYCKHFS
jgi:nitrogen fixation/metabolism regulation signal transduction histidine kinase